MKVSTYHHHHLLESGKVWELLLALELLLEEVLEVLESGNKRTP
jgi:hypothetical protein